MYIFVSKNLKDKAMKRASIRAISTYLTEVLGISGEAKHVKNLEYTVVHPYMKIAHPVIFQVFGQQSEHLNSVMDDITNAVQNIETKGADVALSSKEAWGQYVDKHLDLWMQQYYVSTVPNEGDLDISLLTFSADQDLEIKRRAMSSHEKWKEMLDSLDPEIAQHVPSDFLSDIEHIVNDFGAHVDFEYFALRMKGFEEELQNCVSEYNIENTDRIDVESLAINIDSDSHDWSENHLEEGFIRVTLDELDMHEFDYADYYPHNVGSFHEVACTSIRSYKWRAHSALATHFVALWILAKYTA